MELNPNTKIDDLLTQYPFLLEFLITLSPKFKNLKNPVVRKTMGKVATLKKAAAIGGLKVDDLISKLSAEISQASASKESVTDPKERQAALKQIIRDLHDGKDMEVLKQKFRELVHGVEATEIAKMEQEIGRAHV